MLEKIVVRKIGGLSPNKCSWLWGSVNKKDTLGSQTKFEQHPFKI